MSKNQTKKYSTKESIWVSNHQKQLAKYAGKWIAVSKSKLVSAGDSVSEVMQEVKKKGIKSVPLVTMVPRKDEGPYILWY